MLSASAPLCRKCQEQILEGASFCPWCGVKQVIQIKPRNRGNGEGTVYFVDGVYRAEVCLYSQGRRFRVSKSGFKRKKDALAAIPELKESLQIKAAKANGFEPPDPMEGASLSKVRDAWMKSHSYEKLSESKRTHYRTAWSRMAQTWELRITEIRLSTMQSVVDACPGGYYPKRDIKALYSHLYKYAIRHELLETNRALALELPECKGGTREVWRPDEIAAWWADYRQGHRASRLILIMIYTGLRTGELRAQNPDKVYLKKKYMVGGIKTEAGQDRVIPLADVILPLMAEALQEARYGLMPMRIEDFYDEYAAAVDRIGVRPLSPYSCRHTAATALAEAEVAPAIIQEIMGHADYSTTLGYTHISTRKKVAAVNAVAQEEKDSAASESRL